MERLGLGPDDLLDINPSLVYGRMTGWGQDGPLAKTAGHDINYIALTGALDAIGRKDGKLTPPLNLIGDYGGGGMFLAMGILAAIINVKNGGTGQVVDAAMVDGASVLMTMFYYSMPLVIGQINANQICLMAAHIFMIPMSAAMGNLCQLVRLNPNFILSS